MARVMVHATVACVLVVCVAAGGSVMDASVDGARQHVGRGSVAAGGDHTVVATPEGRVLVWGGGRRGAIGDGALVDRWLPTAVPDLDGIVSASAGAFHTVAVTKDGEVYAWGANSFGRLGDGTTRRRARPVRVRELTNVTMVAAGNAHTLALTADGRVFAWGRNTDGQLGAGNRVTSLVPVQVRDLPGIAAIAAGDAHSLAVAQDGRLFAWGRNQFSMLGDGTAEDRDRPVVVELSDVVSVAGGAAHSLALLRDGSVFSWGRGANGELGTGVRRVASRPTMIPGLKVTAIAAGRGFSAAVRDDGSVVAWGANESGQLGDHTTTSRLRPVVVDGLTSIAALALGDAHGVAVTISGDLYTWGAGGVGQLGNGSTLDQTVPTEVLSDIPDWGMPVDEDPAPVDSVPPTFSIVATPSPIGGWNTTPVTVTFSCQDNVAVASCPAPVVLSNDGSGQLVSRSVVDTAGNAVVAEITINIDRTRPNVAVATEIPQDVSSATLTLDANVEDLVSGLASVSCNGVPATVVGGTAHCGVPLSNGRNLVVVAARDIAGNMASASAVVNRVGTGDATSAYATPATAGLIVGESRTFVMTDDRGRIIPLPSWDSSDLNVISFANGVATAVGVGEATLTATAGSLTATVEIAVYEGPYLPAGATRWNLPTRRPASTVAHTLITDGLDGVQLFSVEYAGDTRTGALVRALGVDGSERWVASLPIDSTEVVADIVSAPGAGLLIVVASGDGVAGHSIVRTGWSESSTRWRYDLPNGMAVHQLLQAPNGFVYVLQASQETNSNWEQVGRRTIDSSEIVGIDGATGARVFRQPLPNYVTYTDSAAGPGLVDEVHGGGGGSLTLTSDGDVYYLLKTGWSSFVEESLFSTKHELIRLSSSGAATAETLYQGSGNFYDQPWGAPGPMIADGEGGVLLEWASGLSVSAPASYSGLYRSPTRSADFAIAALVDPQATSWSGTLIGIQYSPTRTTVAIDMRSGDIKWEAAGIAGDAAVVLNDNGAVFADSDGNYQTIDGQGNVISTAAQGVPKGPYAYGRFHGRDADGTLKAVPSRPLDDATALSNLNQPASIATVPMGQYGVHAKAYNVLTNNQSVFKHLGLALVPRNQKAWLDPSNQWKTYFKQSPSLYGDLWIVTTGGAPTGELLASTLAQRFNNEDGDFWQPANPGYWFPLIPSLEDATVAGLLTKSLYFRDDVLVYELAPLKVSPGYNSNSFLRALLDLQGLTPPAFFTSFRFPGSSKPVPPQYFAP